MKVTPYAMLVVALAGGILCAAEAESPTGLQRLARFQATYDRELSRISTNAAVTYAALEQQYLRTIKSYETSAQADGDLDSLLKYRRERERFEGERTVTTRDLAPADGETPTRIRKLQIGYNSAKQRAALEEAEQVLDLTEKYDRTLSSLQAMLTRAADLEGALAVKDERDALEQRREVASARFVKAETEAEQTSPDPNGEKAVPWDSEPALKEPTPEEMENRIRQRFNALLEVLEGGDKEKAIAYVDPTSVERFGSEIATRILNFYAGLLRVGRQGGHPLNPEKSEIELDGDRATLRPTFWAGDRWQATEQPIRWVRTDGEWYVDVSRQQPNEKDERGWRPMRRDNTRIRRAQKVEEAQ